jgi:argininosuccinate synthase
MSRDETIEYARARGPLITTTKSSPYSVDENLWGRSIECGVLEDPWESPPDDVFELTVPPSSAPAGVHDVEIGFDSGVPASVDGETLDPLAAIEVMTKLGGTHGVGRIDMVEDRLIGIKSREIYEAPAALALIAAHSELEQLVLERALLREKRRLEVVWSELVYEGLWFSPLRESIEAFVSATENAVTGIVRLRFGPGSCAVVGRRSPFALYDEGLATYGSEDAFDHEDSAGFVRLWGLPSRRWAEIHAPR